MKKTTRYGLQAIALLMLGLLWGCAAKQAEGGPMPTEPERIPLPPEPAGMYSGSGSATEAYQLLWEKFLPKEETEDKHLLEKDIPFPEWYGGAFRDNDRRLCILIVEGHEAMAGTIQAELKGQPVKFRSAEFPIHTLYQAQAEIEEEYRGWSAIAVRPMQNRVVVGLPDPGSGEGQALREALEARYPCVEFEGTGYAVPY
jgi:hypothetical protein